jgi:uncharacterized protein YdeI (YjbR/CyaY-like superfamily)
MIMDTIYFENRNDLRNWLLTNHLTSQGILVKIYKKNSTTKSITFLDLLEEGLCFGWSESKRIKGEKEYYLQVFTPRKTKGTASNRNKLLIKKLIEEGKMVEAGLKVL